MCPYYTHFNVDLNRKRKSGKYKKGDPLPGNRFSVTPNHGFYKFWLKTGLAIPPRLSAFNDYMGKLKQFTFIGEIKKGQPTHIIFNIRHGNRFIKQHTNK